MGSGKEIETADGNPPLIDVLGAALNSRLLQASHPASAGQAAAPAAVTATTVGWLAHVPFATTSPHHKKTIHKQ